MTAPGGVALCLAATGLSLGCYTYAPVTLDAVPVGAQVRALLSTEAELALRDSLGVELRPLHGTLVDREEGRVLLSVRAGVGSRELGSQLLYQRVGVAPQDVLRVDVRRLQRGKTVAFALAIAGAATIVAIKAVAILRPGSRDNGGGGPPEQLLGW
ncbi:MAG TPA: hypothetical protein VGQ25_13465 [Gemmatimonadales bacterium]|jgi:hypothetical protein|nr:hypothetical protein [Gemmatimonadales bacterium]